MNLRALVICTALAIGRLSAQEVDVLLLAGEMAPVDRTGHHDYQGGIKVLRECLLQTSGVRVTSSITGWPSESQELTDAEVVVFYCDGGGKQPYLTSPERIAAIDALVARGAGLVLIHQAVDHPAAHVARAVQWMGASYDPAVSIRGHWPSTHKEFPVHELTNGVTAWTLNDGWLASLRFVTDRQGFVPCVWSSKAASGSSSGGDAAITAWGYERPTGGRSFAFTGLDGHEAWKQAGVRQLVTNGVLWSAGLTLPTGGAPCALDDAAIDRLVTPRVDGKRLFNR
jgi:Trehalose utilisation